MTQVHRSVEEFSVWERGGTGLEGDKCKIDDVEALEAVRNGLISLFQCGKSLDIGKPGRVLETLLLRNAMVDLLSLP